MEWRRLDNETELHGFRDMLRARFGSTSAEWGPSPVDYPCLIAYLRTTPERFVPVVVYRADAAGLLGIATDEAGVPTLQQQQAAHDDHYRSVAAHLLTIVKWLRDVGCYKQDTYERDFAAMLARVDRWTAEDHAKLLAGHVPSMAD